jgi:hypothetical protein
MDADEEDGVKYDTAAARVDYGGANRAVFFDFSTGTVTELAHDFFDIAIDASGNIIANSGSYGSGVQVYKTDEAGANIGNDFSADEAKVKEYTFRDGVKIYEVQGGGAAYQTTQNPLGSLADLMPPGTKSKVFLVKVQYGDTAEYFKVVFSMTMGQTQSFNMEVVPGLGSGTTNKVDINAGVTGVRDGYGWLYFKLVGTDGPRVLNDGTTWTGGGTAVPQSPDWDILFTRTIEFQSKDGTSLAAGMNVAGRSSVLLNIYKKVEAAKAEGVRMEDVSSKTDGLTFSDAVDAIGYGWYNTSSDMPPTYSVPTNTFVVKTAEGKYAKFQPGTFSGPNNESFYMSFRYLYSDDDSENFEK